MGIADAGYYGLSLTGVLMRSSGREMVETKEAGAAGVIGVITSVLGKGTPVLTQFAAAIGACLCRRR